MKSRNRPINELDLLLSIAEELFLTFDVTQTIWTRLPLFNIEIDEKLLTHRLPALGKAVDRSFNTFKLESEDRQLLYAFAPLLYKVYYDGVWLMTDCDASHISSLRQLTYTFYKLEAELEIPGQLEALQKFIDTDMDVLQCPKLGNNTNAIINLVSSSFQKILPKEINIRRFLPSGATYPRTTIAERYSHLDGEAHYVSYEDLYTCQASGPGGRSKIAFVPKDSRGPRTICVQPLQNMSFQLGLMYDIYDSIESSRFYRRRISCLDQSINQRRAYLGSCDNSLATIDLKDASDRISYKLIKLITSKIPVKVNCVRDSSSHSSTWWELLELTRSKTWVSPVNFDKDPLLGLLQQEFIKVGDRTYSPNAEYAFRKFAPMGNALTFPIETILFYSMAQLFDVDSTVFGDDIIIKATEAPKLMKLLTHFGLVVNEEKSFINGPFRESCGHDYFNGHLVTPVRLKSLSLGSVTAFVNNLALKLDTALSSRWIHILNEQFKIVLPTVQIADISTTPFLALCCDSYSHNEVLFARRYNEGLQKFEVLFPFWRYKAEKSDISSYGVAHLEMRNYNVVSTWYDNLFPMSFDTINSNKGKFVTDKYKSQRTGLHCKWIWT